MSDTFPHANGRLSGQESKATKKKATRTRRALVATATQVNNYRRYITVGAGCFIPLLSLSLSHMGGSRVTSESLAEMLCGFGLLGLCITVLCVSLGHLSEAVQDITKSTPKASWMMAVAVDLTMVTTELSTTFATNDADSWLRVAVMAAVTVGSMILNCWAFLKHSAAK